MHTATRRAIFALLVVSLSCKREAVSPHTSERVAGLNQTHTEQRAECTGRIFLLPAKFRGPVVVLYDDPRGMSNPLSDGEGRVVFEVPRDGVIRLKGAAPQFLVGTVDYFWQNGLGSARISIPRDERLPRTEVQVFMETTGVLPGRPRRRHLPNADATVEESSTSFAGSIRYDFFLVGIPAARDDWYELKQTFIETAAHGRASDD